MIQLSFASFLNPPNSVELNSELSCSFQRFIRDPKILPVSTTIYLQICYLLLYDACYGNPISQGIFVFLISSQKFQTPAQCWLKLSQGNLGNYFITHEKLRAVCEDLSDTFAFLYSIICFFVTKPDGLTIGKIALCMKVPLKLENIIPRVVESEIEFKVTIN